MKICSSVCKLTLGPYTSGPVPHARHFSSRTFKACAEYWSRLLNSETRARHLESLDLGDLICRVASPTTVGIEEPGLGALKRIPSALPPVIGWFTGGLA